MEVLPGLSETGRDALGYLGGGILAMSLIPQIIKLVMTRSAADISLAWSLLYLIGTGLSFVYLLLLGALAAWIPVAFELVGCVITISLKLLYDHTTWGQNQQLQLQQEQFKLWQEQYVESMRLAALQEEGGNESSAFGAQPAQYNAADEPTAAVYAAATPSKCRLGLATGAAADFEGVKVKLAEPGYQMLQLLGAEAVAQSHGKQQPGTIKSAPHHQQLEALQCSVSEGVSADGSAAASTLPSASTSAAGCSTAGSSKSGNLCGPQRAAAAAAVAAALSGSDLAAMHIGQHGKVPYGHVSLPWYSQTGISHAAALPVQTFMHCCYVCGAPQLCSGGHNSQHGGVVPSGLSRMFGNVLSSVTGAPAGGLNKPSSRDPGPANRCSLDMPNLHAAPANHLPATGPAVAAAGAEAEAAGTGLHWGSFVRPSKGGKPNQIGGGSIKRMWRNMLFSGNGGDRTAAHHEHGMLVRMYDPQAGTEQCLGVSIHAAAGAGAASTQHAAAGTSSSGGSSISSMRQVWHNVLFSVSDAGRVKGSQGEATSLGGWPSRRVTLDMPHLETEAASAAPAGMAAQVATATGASNGNGGSEHEGVTEPAAGCCST